MKAKVRRLLGYQWVRVIDEATPISFDFARHVAELKISRQHFEWRRVRPWWKVWK